MAKGSLKVRRTVLISTDWMNRTDWYGVGLESTPSLCTALPTPHAPISRTPTRGARHRQPADRRERARRLFDAGPGPGAGHVEGDALRLVRQQVGAAGRADPGQRRADGAGAARRVGTRGRRRGLAPHAGAFLLGLARAAGLR